MSSEKTEQATEHRKKLSREKGEGVRSRELLSSVAMLAGLVLLPSAAMRFVAMWRGVYSQSLALAMQPVSSVDAWGKAVPSVLVPGLLPAAVVVAAAFAAAAGMGLVQANGLQFHVEALALKPSRLSPLANVKNMMSARSLVRLLKSLLPAAVVVVLAYRSLGSLVLPLPVTTYARLPVTFAVAYALALHTAWISVAWSGVDYVIEWRAWNKNLKMSKQDVRQEAKEQNGNPHTKGRVRQIQRAMRRRRVRADMSRAAVVITNPTHYAVALEFSFSSLAAPRVLCKGRDLHAAEIRDQARWAGVPLVENPPLARSLYRGVEEGQAIPFELYAAVAAILAFLVRPQTRSAHASTPRTVVPILDLIAAATPGSAAV